MAAQSSSLFYKSWAWLAGLPVTFIVAQQSWSFFSDPTWHSLGIRSLLANIAFFCPVICLLSLAAAVVHTSAMKRITDRRTPIWSSALATFLASLTLVYAFRVLLFIRALFTSNGSFSVSDTMAEIVGVVFLLLFLVYIPMPWWITPRLEHIVRARQSLRELRTSGTPSRQCSECGTFTDVAKIGLPAPTRYRAAIWLATFLFALGFQWLLAANNRTNGYRYPQVAYSASTKVLPADLSNTNLLAELKVKALASATPHTIDFNNLSNASSLVLHFNDYSGGASVLIQYYGWPVSWWTQKTTSYYDDPQGLVGPRPLPDQLTNSQYHGWSFNPGPLSRMTFTRERLLSNNMVLEYIEVNIASILISLMIALTLSTMVGAVLTLWQRMGPPRWRRYFRTAEGCCADCGYPLSPATPAT